jgi:hypothetical protein
MKKKGGDLIAPVLNRSVGKLGPFDLLSQSRFTPTQPLRSFPGRPVQAPGLPSPPARAATKGVSPYAVGGTAVVGGGALGVGIAATDQIEGALNRVGPAVDRFFGRITPQAIQQFGKEQENKGWGGALEMATPLGFLAAPFIPNTRSSSKPSGSRPIGTQAVLNGKPVYWGGDNYGWQSLNGTGSSATLNALNVPGAQSRFTQDPGFRPIGGTPAERAQAAETSRVAQLTAQDPELQRYEAARLKAVAPGATAEQVQSAEDIGMQMWAKANPTLAAKVKAGQSGYEAIQGTLAGNMARAGQGFGITEQLVPTPQGFPTQVPGLPTSAGYSTGFGVTSNLAPGAQTPPPYSTIKPTSELSGLGAAPLGTATTSVFGQPNVMDAAKFEELLKLVKK